MIIEVTTMIFSQNPSTIQVRKSRLLYRTIHTGLEKLYSEQELQHLIEVYDKHVAVEDANVATFHSMLQDLDLKVEEVELADLVESFFLYAGQGASEDAGVGQKSAGPDAGQGAWVAPERIWNFETFAKIVALMVDQESRRKN